MSSGLKKKVSAFGLALVAVLALSGAAAGSASALSLSAGAYPAEFISEGGLHELRVENQGPISCNQSTGTGQFNNSTSGETTITLSKCSQLYAGFKIACTSPGNTSGTIVTSSLSIKPVSLDAAQPNSGFYCSLSSKAEA